jgi:excisionase family DNA binding protein
MSTSIQRLTYTLDEASVASGVSRSTLYRLMDRGELRFVKIGARRLIPAGAPARLCEPDGRRHASPWGR